MAKQPFKQIIQLINNVGDIGKTLKDLRSSAAIKQLATSVAVSGALAGMGNIAANADSQVSAKVAEEICKGSISNFTGTFTTNLINGAASAGVNMTINGGSVKDNLKMTS